MTEQSLSEQKKFLGIGFVGWFNLATIALIMWIGFVLDFWEFKWVGSIAFPFVILFWFYQYRKA